MAASAAIAAVNAAQCAIVAWLLGRACRIGVWARGGASVPGISVHGIRYYGSIALGACTAPTIGSFVLCLSGDDPWSAFCSNWAGWWMGDVLGITVLAPLAFEAWARLERKPGIGSWRVPTSLSIMPLGVVVFGLHTALEHTVVIALPGGLSPDAMQVAIGLVADAAFVGIGVLIRRSDALIRNPAAAGEQLRRSDEKFRALFDGAPDAYFLMSGQEGARIVACNKAAARMLRGPEDRILGKTAVDFSPPRQPDGVPSGEAVARIIASFQRGNAPIEFEFVHRRLDGDDFWVSVSVANVTIAEQQFQLVAWRDITQRKAAEAELQQSGKKFRGLLETAPDAMVIVDAGGRIALVNTQTEKMFGYAREELQGQTVELLIPERARAAHPGHRERFMQDPHTRGMGSGLELFGRRKDDSEFPVEISLSPIETAEGVMVSAAIRDISERKRFEAHLRESQKMEAIGQLTGGLAHDFNNLLGIVVGNLELIGDRLPDDDGLKRRHETALNAALRGAEVTRALLAVARRQSLVSIVADLNEVLEQMLPLARTSAGAAVTLRLEPWQAELPVKLDAAGLSNAVLNLVINAQDAMAGKVGEPRLVLRTRRERVAGGNGVPLPEGDYAVLEVVDNGSGMSDEVRTRAFEPFYTTKEVGHGTGLGLSMVRGFAEQLGGTAQLESEPGLGTTVRLYLPIDPGQGPIEHKPAASDSMPR